MLAGMPRKRVQPQAPGRQFVAGLVLAAPASNQVWRPHPLLPYGHGTLLGHVLSTARRCPFDQILVALGDDADTVRASVDLSGCTIVDSPTYGDARGSSIAASLLDVDKRADLLVLMLGDQPGVAPEAVTKLLAGRGKRPIAFCRYANGRGFPYAFAPPVFRDLATMRDDDELGVLVHRRSFDVAEVRVPGSVPLHIDPADDYRSVLAAESLDGSPETL